MEIVKVRNELNKQIQRERNNEYNRLKTEYNRAINLCSSGDLDGSFIIAQRIQKTDLKHPEIEILLQGVQQIIDTIKTKREEFERLEAERVAQAEKAAQEKLDELIAEQKKARHTANQGDYEAAMNIFENILTTDLIHPQKEEFISRINADLTKLNQIIYSKLVDDHNRLISNPFLNNPLNDPFLYMFGNPKNIITSLETILKTKFNHPKKDELFSIVTQDIAKVRRMEAERKRREQAEELERKRREQAEELERKRREATLWGKTKKVFGKINWSGLAYLLLVFLLCGAGFFGTTYLHVLAQHWILELMFSDIPEISFWGEFILLSFAEIIWVVTYIYGNDSFVSYGEIFSGRTVWHKMVGLLTSIPLNFIVTYILAHLLAILEIKVFDEIYQTMFFINFSVLTIIGIISLIWLDESQKYSGYRWWR